MKDNPSPRLQQQIEFLTEIDKLKTVERQTLLMNGSRRENSAEHSWHLGMLALVLLPYSKEAVDLSRLFKILMLHDLVEIDAGDTFGYDAQAVELQAEKEKAAANRIFGLLPADQAGEFRSLWDEYEEGSSPEARFARALDRFQPLLNNFSTQGGSWIKHGVTAAQVRKRVASWAKAAPELQQYAEWLIEESVRRGYLATT